jgi:hypothetical protein
MALNQGGGGGRTPVNYDGNENIAANPGHIPAGAIPPGGGAKEYYANLAAQAAQATSPGYSGYSGSGYVAPVSSFNLSLQKPERYTNPYKMPAAMADGADDPTKAKYWTDAKQFYGGAAEELMSVWNIHKANLAELEAKLSSPGYKMTEADAQNLLNHRQSVANAENDYRLMRDKYDTINVSVGVSTSKDGDNEKVTKTYTITDDKGNTVNTQYSEDNGGMSADQLRNKQTQDQQKALDASSAQIRAEAQAEIERIQAGAERDYAVGQANTSLDAWNNQYERNLGLLNSGFAQDKLQGNQDLLMASNNTFENAVKNSREANQILGQYNLGGSSLGDRMNRIAAEAANQSNQVAALTYNQRMQDAQKNYDTSRTQLEDQNAAQHTANSQANAQANADYYARLGQTAGKAYEDMAQYANSDYWYGTMFDEKGNRLNSYADMDSQAMKDYASNQANKYNNYMNQYKNQQQQMAEEQTKQKGNAYISDYQQTAKKTYETGLKMYQPVNTTTQVPGTPNTGLEQKGGNL